MENKKVKLVLSKKSYFCLTLPPLTEDRIPNNFSTPGSLLDVKAKGKSANEADDIFVFSNLNQVNFFF